RYVHDSTLSRWMLFYIVYISFFFFLRVPSFSTLFPSRRSSDLAPVHHGRHGRPGILAAAVQGVQNAGPGPDGYRHGHRDVQPAEDRKSTRLNSSHVSISYAVFCLKEKKQARSSTLTNRRAQSTY